MSIKSKKQVSRRQFVKGSVAVSATAFSVPNIIKAAISAPPSEKLNCAVIGCGAISSTHCRPLAKSPMTNLVGLCDADWGYSAVKKAFKEHPDVKKYRDYRKLLEDKSLDAVVVSTCEHHHFPAAMLAMKMGKHVYCQKPLALTVEECRLMAKTAKECKVATQMGNQGHCGQGTQIIKSWFDAGVLGDVREVHFWMGDPLATTPFKREASSYVDRPLPVPSGTDIPEGLDWDLFLGPLPMRPYVAGYARRAWLGWIETAGGICTGFGTHHGDASFWALQLDAPETIEAESIPVTPKNSWPGRAGGGGVKVTWQYPARGKLPPVKVTFFTNQYARQVRRPKDLEPGRNLSAKRAFGGQLFFGDKATLLASHMGGSPRLVPETKMQAEIKNLPPKPTRYEGGHTGSWLLACKGGKPAPSHFGYSARLTEACLLGSIAIRTGRKLHWEPETMTFKNDPEATAMLTTEYRKGWDMRKL